MRVEYHAYYLTDSLRWLSWKCILTLFLVITLSSFVDSYEYNHSCSIERRPIVSLSLDMVDKTYRLYEEFLEEDSNSTLRNETIFMRRTLSGNGNIIKLVEAKECYCSPGYYCLGRDTSMCGVDISTGETECVTLPRSYIFLQHLLPVIALWYFGITMSLVFTRNGRLARNYVVSFCCASVVGAMVDEEIERLNQIRAVERAEENANNQILVLKVKAYNVPDEEEDVEAENGRAVDVEMVEQTNPKEETDDAMVDTKNLCSVDVDSFSSSNSVQSEAGEQCTICTEYFKEGDRIGALPCQHNFHSDCLKSWLQRRNVCPLCLQTDIAHPKNACTV